MGDRKGRELGGVTCQGFTHGVGMGELHPVGMGEPSPSGDGGTFTQWGWGNLHPVGMGEPSPSGDGGTFTQWGWGNFHPVGMGEPSPSGDGGTFTQWGWGNLQHLLSHSQNEQNITETHCLWGEKYADDSPAQRHAFLIPLLNLWGSIVKTTTTKQQQPESEL